MDESAIIAYIRQQFPGVEIFTASKENGAPEIAWGDVFFFYDPDRRLDPQARWPFATLVVKDYPNFDTASNLDRPGVFRLNIGVSKATFQAKFSGGIPSAESNAQPPANEYDFAALDRILPHPVYGPQHWLCILNPSQATFTKSVAPLLAEAYSEAVRKYLKTHTGG